MGLVIYLTDNTGFYMVDYTQANRSKDLTVIAKG